MIRTIPLAKLTPSPRNVRRAVDEAADLQLKADIEARGLLQNLVVSPAKKPRGTYTVEAGGRRLRALASLLEEGKLAADHAVHCLVLDGSPAAAQEASLAENFQRLAMNPADECLAFGRLIAQGADVEGIARRFGLTVRFVEGRLRLSALAPAIFEALGAGEITLDLAKAYAVTSDQERQAFVFEQLRGSYTGTHPDSIRRIMTQASASATDPRALLVGEEAYLAAGGRIERDLFSDESGACWLDLPLLERLAAERMDVVAADMAADLGLAWVRPTLDSWAGYALTAGLERFVPEREPLTDEETARIEAAYAEIEALETTFEDEDAPEEAREQAEERVAALEREIAALRDKPPVLDAAQKLRLGTFLLLDRSGTPRLDGVFYREPEPESEPDGSEEDAAEGGCSDAAADVAKGDGAGDGKMPQPLARTLIDELAMQRRDILAAHVGRDPVLATDLATFLMIDRDACYPTEPSGSSLLALAPADPVHGFKTAGAAATVAREKAADALDRSWTGRATRAERFDAFRALSDDARGAWLAHAVAHTLQASANAPGERRCAFHDHLGCLAGIDPAAWWRPTGANFFDRVPKSVTLLALEEVGDPAFASAYSGLKKAQLAQAAERIFAGEEGCDAEIKARALAWLPAPMRFAVAADDVRDNTGTAMDGTANDDVPPWEELPAAGLDEAAAEPQEQGDIHVVVDAEPGERLDEAA